MNNKKTSSQILTDLKKKHNKEIQTLENELIIKERFAKLNIDIKRLYVHDVWKKDDKQLISIDLDNLKALNQLLKKFKPIDMYYIDNTFTNCLKKWEKQSITMQDDTTLNGIEYNKKQNKFFKCGFGVGLDFENHGHSENEVKIQWYSKEFNFWVKLPLKVFSQNCIYSCNEVDRYETEKAREYNHRAKDIYKVVSYHKGLHKIGFYGGMKRCFATNDIETEALLTFLEVV